MTSAAPLTAAEQKQIEVWFTHQGLPNLIDDYRASTDVFTRAAPLLLLLWLFAIAGAFGDRFTGWSQALAALAGAGFLLGVGIGVNRLRGRAPLQIPDRVGPLELGAFVFAPAILPAIVDNGSVSQFVLTVLGGLAALLVVWFMFGFGVGAILRWAIGNLWRQLSDVFGLMIRSLPLLLVFTMFLFMNAELWQVAHDFTTPLFFTAAGGLVLVALLFVLVRLPSELEDIGRFADAEQVEKAVGRSGAPTELCKVDPTKTPELSRNARFNVGLLAAFSIGVQIALVMMIIGVFYMMFGLVTVRPNTIEQWTVGGAGSVERLVELQLFGADIPITTDLLKVTGFLMAFTALQFTVSALTDATFREQFFEKLTLEIREALAVRVVYLSRVPSAAGESDGPSDLAAPVSR
ncbi:MAG: hypothetical protein ACRBK7_10515 [Acidimicrobiales bacterium]